eukprot:9491592-Pyramimonas_sp.AAC.3
MALRGSWPSYRRGSAARPYTAYFAGRKSPEPARLLRRLRNLMHLCDPRTDTPPQWYLPLANGT